MDSARMLRQCVQKFGTLNLSIAHDNLGRACAAG